MGSPRAPGTLYAPVGRAIGESGESSASMSAAHPFAIPLTSRTLLLVSYHSLYPSYLLPMRLLAIPYLIYRCDTDCDNEILGVIGYTNVVTSQ